MSTALAEPRITSLAEREALMDKFTTPEVETLFGPRVTEERLQTILETMRTDLAGAERIIRETLAELA